LYSRDSRYKAKAKAWMRPHSLPFSCHCQCCLQSQFAFPVGSYQPLVRYTFYAYARNPVGEGPPSDPVSLRAPPR